LAPPVALPKAPTGIERGISGWGKTRRPNVCRSRVGPSLIRRWGRKSPTQPALVFSLDDRPVIPDIVTLFRIVTSVRRRGGRQMSECGSLRSGIGRVDGVRAGRGRQPCAKDVRPRKWSGYAASVSTRLWHQASSSSKVPGPATRWPAADLVYAVVGRSGPPCSRDFVKYMPRVSDRLGSSSMARLKSASASS
jgi:hypothetical protein